MPLLNLTAGKLSASVNLSYASSGIKVDQVASWVGLGWNLNSGGVITRTVRGTADETAATRPFTTYSTVQGWKNASDKTAYINFVESVNDPYKDYEPDLYNFNFGGYSGSFYLDSNFEPVLTKHDNEVKIERISNNSTGKFSFLITTPLGVKYHFGDASNDKGIEYSKAVSYSGQAHGDPAQNLPTSWYIKKVVHPSGDEIYYDYDYSAYYLLTTGFSQEYKKILYQLQIDTESCAPIPEGLTTTSLGNYIQSIKLSKISSNRTNETINFHATKSRTDLSGEYKLDSISLKKGTTLIKSYGLDYDFITSSINYYGASGKPWLTETEHFTRMYLSKVYEKDNQGSATNGKEHSFEYEDREGLPPRMSFSQDLLGFYNGEINNSFLPDHVDTNYYNFSAVLRGDRSSNFNYAKKGTLTKVIYPTKGYTILEYEPAIELVTTSYNNRSSFSMDVNNLMSTVFTQDIYSAYDQPIELLANLTILNGGLDYIHDVARVIVKNKSTNVEIFDQIIKYNTTGSFVVELDANITYEVKISLDNVLEDEVRTTLNFDYISSVSTSTSPENKTGIRIKKVRNKANDTAPEEITRYYYTNKENLNDSSFKELRAFNFIEVDTGINGDNCGNSWALWHQYTQVKLKSSSLTHYRRLISEQIMYETVVMSKGDNFEGGGVEKHFQVHLAPSNYMIHGQQINNATRTNQYDLENGTLTKEIAFTKEEGIINEVSEKRFVYKTDASKSSSLDAYTSNFRFEQHQLTSNNTMGAIDGIDVGVYQLHNKWIALDSVITKQFFGANTITSTQKYTYGTGLAGLPTETSSVNSAGDVLKTKTYYPGNINYIYDLGFDDLTIEEKGAIDRMKAYDLYMIGTPIQNQTYKNGTLLSTNRTNFHEPYTDKILVKNIQTAKGTNPLKDRIIFHSYYANGNVKEISRKDGTHVVYIWGYNETMPIAKIENATYADISSYVSNLQNKSDLDIDASSEQTLRSNLETLRVNLSSDALMTYYTYDPLIGTTSITSPRGKTMYYQYDSLGRLETVKDHDGKILSKNEYNYKN